MNRFTVVLHLRNLEKPTLLVYAQALANAVQEAMDQGVDPAEDPAVRLLALQVGTMCKTEQMMTDEYSDLYMTCEDEVDRQPALIPVTDNAPGITLFEQIRLSLYQFATKNNMHTGPKIIQLTPSQAKEFLGEMADNSHALYDDAEKARSELMKITRLLGKKITPREIKEYLATITFMGCRVFVTDVTH
jgi:hypothetical protein